MKDYSYILLDFIINIGVPAQSGPGIIMPEELGPIEPTEPAETPLITTEVAIITAVVVAVVIGIVSYWVLRKRK